MPRSNSFQAKSFILVLLFFLFWWVTPVVVKNWTRVVFYEFHAPSWTALSYLRDLQQFFGLKTHSKNDLIEAGVDMARLYAAYSVKNQRSEYLERENQRLESFFDLPPRTNFRYEVARVVRRDSSTWWNQLIIRKGQMHGLKVGQAVVYLGGVAGRITQVDSYTATVELISSPTFRTVAQFEGDSRPVEFQGGLNPGFGAPIASISNVPADIQANYDSPKTITSSSLGGVFPDGIHLGTIYQLEMSPGGIFQKGKVRLDPTLLEIREVAVLVPIEPREE